MSPEEFARFLEYLSPDMEEAGRKYTRLHEKLVGFIKLKGISAAGKAADETLDRAAVKICAGAPVPNVHSYCLGIARNVVKEWFRREQREKSAFLGFVDELKDGFDEEIERIERLLKPCFNQLDGEEQELLIEYCKLLRGRARAEHRRQMAETMKTSVLALRMRVTRLRSILSECLEKRAREGLAPI